MHTPGPWTMEEVMGEDEVPDKALIRAPRAGDGLVATVYTRADSCLTAAAPELLEALQAFVDYHATDYDDIPEMEQARAAIAKAKGESVPA